MVRSKVREMIKVVGEELKDPIIEEFSRKVDQFFYSSVSYDEQMSIGNMMIDRLEMIETNEVSFKREDIKQFIDFSLKSMEANWIAICQSYAVTRIKLIK